MLPDEDKGRYNTVAGLMQTVAGDLLAQADSVECAGWRFEVLVLDGRRIDQVLISRLPDTDAEDGGWGPTADGRGRAARAWLSGDWGRRRRHGFGVHRQARCPLRARSGARRPGCRRRANGWRKHCWKRDGCPPRAPSSPPRPRPRPAIVTAAVVS